jgi:hypothetical protein
MLMDSGYIINAPLPNLDRSEWLATRLDTALRERDALAARLAEAEALVKQADFCPFEDGALTEEEWITKWRAFMGLATADSAPACNHFPGQVNCEWCTEPERAT